MINFKSMPSMCPSRCARLLRAPGRTDTFRFLLSPISLRAEKEHARRCDTPRRGPRGVARSAVRPTNVGSAAPSGLAVGIGRDRRTRDVRQVQSRHVEAESQARLRGTGERYRKRRDRDQKRELAHGNLHLARVAGTKRSGLLRPAPLTPASDGHAEFFASAAGKLFVRLNENCTPAKKLRHPAAGDHGVSRGPVYARRRTQRVGSPADAQCLRTLIEREWIERRRE